MAANNANTIAAANGSAVPWDRIQSEYTRALQWDQMQAASRLSSQSGAGAATLPAPVVSGLSSAVKPPVDIEVMRVSQLDAHHLDRELTAMLGYQFRRVFKYLDTGLLTQMKPEIDAVLQYLIYRFTIHRDIPTPGLQLQNLQYRNERVATPAMQSMSASDLFTLSASQKFSFALLSIGGRWAWTRFYQWMISNGWASYPEGAPQHTCYHVCRYADQAYLVSTLVNFLVFLRNGRYRSLLERLLCMRLVYIRSRIGREVDFEYMNQQLVWHGFSEFLLFLMPLIDFERIKRFFWKMIDFRSLGDGAALQIERDFSCPVCQAKPIVTPYAASCGDLFCYYCLTGSRMADSAFTCPRCNQRISSQRRATVADLSGQSVPS